MTGFCLKLRPRAFVSYFGYGDITALWYSKPDAFYRQKSLVRKEEAYQCVAIAPFLNLLPRTSVGDSICIAVSKAFGPTK